MNKYGIKGWITNGWMWIDRMDGWVDKLVDEYCIKG